MNIKKEDYEKIRKNILKKLYSCKAFKKGHLLLETLQKGIPSHLVGYSKDILKELVKENLVSIYGKTKHGMAFQLSINKIEEIEKIIFN
jgi:hypothetical protein